MLLSISNIKNIKKAEIEFDGLTVLVGENDTGKSTVSKSLYSIFASLGNLPVDRENLLKEKFVDLLKPLDFMALIPRQRYELLDELVNYRFSVENGSISDDEIYKYIRSLIDKYMKNTKSNISNFDNVAIELTKSLRTISDDELNSDCVRKYLIAEFKDIIYNVKDDNYDSSISVGLHYNKNGNKNDVIGYKKVNSILVDGKNNNSCSVKLGEAITNKIFYYDGLNVDYNLTLNDANMLFRRNAYLLPKSVSRYSHKSMFDQEIFFDHYSNNDSKSEFNDLFEDFKDLGGIYVNDELDDTLYINNRFKKPIDSHQIAQGLKGLLVFRQLIINKRLSEYDLLIFDEPEINLHPKWQVAFAKLIVKLQLKYKLTILLCSHSPFFVEAIKVFAKYFNIESKTKFYLATKDLSGYNVINDVTKNIDAIFKSLAEPYFAIREYEQNE